MKQWLKIFALLWAALGIGCTQEPEELVPGGDSSGQLGIYLTLPDRTEITTRSAAADEAIDPQSVCVLIFSGNDNNSALLDWGVATSITAGGISFYGIKLADRKEACYAYVVVNFLKGVQSAAANWAKGSTSLAQVRQSLVTEPLPTQSNVITDMPTAHPMCGAANLPHGISASTTIGSSANPVLMTPATVKITIRNQVIQSSSYTFELEGATLFNAPDRGYVIPETDKQGIHYLPYGLNGDVSEMMVGTEKIEGKTNTNPLYCYPSESDNETSVIVKALYNGEVGYYRLNFFTPDKSALRDLIGGYHYKIVLHAAQTAGYRTIEEACTNRASNGIVYDIAIEDPDSYDVITNGVQYLGVSNSEYWMYNNNYINQFESYYDETEDIAKATPFTITVLTYTTSRTWREGEITASAGIHLQSESGAKTDRLKLPIAADESTPVRCELKAFFDDDFQRGTLDIRIGDLHKVITVKRKHSASILGETFSLGKDVVYASIRAVDNRQTKTDPTVYGLSYSEQGDFCLTGNTSGELDPAQSLYLKVNSRFENKSADYCYSTMYLHRNTGAGRVKVDLAADMHGQEIWGDYSYNPMLEVLGTFHRNSERGERLVQIPQCRLTLDVPYSGRWQVRVIKGDDFIRLGEWDPNLTMTDGVFDGDPESRPVEGDKTMISGKDFTVRFRIGLTSTNEGKSNRYGLIQLIYVEKRPNQNIDNPWKMSCFIFVRQGEEPDNLLSPGKSYVDIEGNPFFAPNVKFSAYELVDPKLGKGGADVSDHTLIAKGGRAVLAPYPSWFGYQFQWGQRRAYHPGVANSALTGWESSSTNPEGWSSDFQELCPEGYITPPARVDGTTVSHALRCTGMNSNGNFYGPGVYLDGYQDRRIEVVGNEEVVAGSYNQITVYNNAYERTLSSYMDSNGAITKDVLNTGYLIYNKETMASLYLPVASGRANTDGSPWADRRVDPFLIFWTRDIDGNNALNANAMLLYDHSFGILDKSYAFRVRCIKDPSKN